MDSNVSVFSIQDEIKYSKQDLEALSTQDPKSLPIPECYSEIIDIKEIPDVAYGMVLNIIMKNNVSYFSPMFVLFNLKENGISIRGTFSFYIKSANYSSSFGSELFNYKCGGHGPEICSFEDLFNFEKKFIVNGKCCIEVKGVFHVESSIEKCEHQQTLGRYLWNRDDHDFTIFVGKENESKTEIKVHKCVLAARSPVFDAMLSTNMKEKAESKVEIIDFDFQTVKNAIAFCYDQSTPYTLTEATTLLQFADKYDIQVLKNRLEQYFMTIAVPENMCEIANASIISNSSKLRGFCVQKMFLLSKMEIPIDNFEILDKDITLELMKKCVSFHK